MLEGFSFGQHPWYWLSAVGIVVPIVIHLFNRYRANLLPFAPLALLPEQKQQVHRQIQLNQRLLLLLRILLLLLIAALLAVPYFPLNKQDSGLILLSQDWLNTSSRAEKQQLAEHLAKHTALLLDSPARHDLQRKLDAEQILNWSPAPASNPGNVWAKIASFSSQLPATAELSVYVTNRAAQFSGPRSQLTHKINWQIKELSGEPGDINKGNLHIALYVEQDRQTTQTYLAAALQALQAQDIGEFSYHTTWLTELNTRPAELAAQQQDVIIWLSDLAVPEALLAQVKQGSRLILEAPDDEQSQRWQSQHNEELTGQRLASSAHPSFKANLARLRWQTVSQQTLLSEYALGQGKLIQFYSRFEPSWSKATQSVAFPLLLAEMIAPAEQNAAAVLPPEQIIGFAADEKPPSPLTAPYPVADNTHSDWLIVLISWVFLAERVLSERQKRSRKIVERQGFPH